MKNEKMAKEQNSQYQIHQCEALCFEYVMFTEVLTRELFDMPPFPSLMFLRDI